MGGQRGWPLAASRNRHSLAPVLAKLRRGGSCGCPALPVTKRTRPYKGKLIAVEGLDGSGKSTQIHLVKRWLESEGYRVFFTQWNSSALVKRATSKGKDQRLLTPTTFSLIHATDFADRYERQILPLLRAGTIVLADRYIYTAFARDGVRGCDFEWLEKLYK